MKGLAMNTTMLWQVAVLALATTAISRTTSQGKIFAPAREWVSTRSEWLGKLVNCAYCTSHWVAIVFVVIYRPRLVSVWMPVDLVVTMFMIVALATLFNGALTWLAAISERASRAQLLSEVAQLRSALQAARGKLVQQAARIKELEGS